MMSRDVGVPGSPSGAAVRANNIEVTAAENGYTSSSVIKLDKVHVLRQTDIVEGQGITTASVSNGRGVRVSVKPDDLNALGYLTTSTVRTIAGEPLYVTSHTLNYVDIGTTGGRHQTWEGLTFKAPASTTFPNKFDQTNLAALPLRSSINLVGDKNYSNAASGGGSGGSGANQLWGNYLKCYAVEGFTDEYIHAILGHRFKDGSMTTSSAPMLAFYGPTGVGGGTLTAIYSGAGMALFSGGIYIRGSGDIEATGEFSELILSHVGSSAYIGGRSTDWPNPQIGSLHANLSVLAKNDIHAGDGLYVGDPAGNITGTNQYNGHLRTYGHMLADPNNNDRYGTTGTINIRTNGVASDNVLRMYTDANGVYLDSKVSGDGYPTQAPAKVQFNILDPTYITGQLGASGDIYTSGSVFAGNDVSATDDVTASDDIIATDLVQGADVTATDDLAVTDDATITGALNVGTAAGTTNGVLTIRKAAANVLNTMIEFQYQSATNFGWRILQDDNTTGDFIIQSLASGVATTVYTLGRDTLRAQFAGQIVSNLNAAGNSSTAQTINWNNANVQSSTLTGSVTYTFSNPISGGEYTLIMTQGGAGSFTATWPAAVKWSGGTAPTLTTTVGKVDVVRFVYDGTSYYGSTVGLNY
jgi:hypothetical protein